jgi:hypothetical protein
MKKKKQVKTDKEQVKQQTFDQDKPNKIPEKIVEESSSGGMNMSNFTKNLGCGS